MQARMWPDDPSPGAARSATQAASASRTPDRNGGSAPRSVLTVTRRPGDAGPEGGDEPCRRAPGSSACRSVRTGRRTSVSRWETPDRISAETDVGEPFDGGTPVGVALVAPDYTIIVADAAAQMWLAELCDGARDGVPHLAVRTVVGTARRIAAGQAPHGVVAEARVRAASGRWLLLRGSTLGDGRGVPTALIVETGTTPRTRSPRRGILRPDPPRAGGRPARGAGPVDQCDRWSAAPVRLDRAGPPQVHFREGRGRQPG